MRKKKQMLWWVGGWALALVLLAVIIPSVLVKSMRQEVRWAGGLSEPPSFVELLSDDSEQEIIPVYLTESGTIEYVPLETYVRGVVAAEMPIEFELEALKAQAIAARTYIYRRIIKEDFSDLPTEDAIVSDSVQHQAYWSMAKLEQTWSRWDYTQNIGKLNRAVNETAGVIAVFNHEPIQAMFFSTSNGFTENSEEYFRDQLPYLRSVPSEWDQALSPRYEQRTSFPYNELKQLLGVATSDDLAGSGPLSIQILKETSGGRIASIRIEGEVFSGREVREKLGLPSSHFFWTQAADEIVFTTYGYGHGVGMSQWGANGMAKEGSTAAEILSYYYQGIQLQKLSSDTLALASERPPK